MSLAISETVLDKVTPSEERPKVVPGVVHFIWFGTKPLSFIQYVSIVLANHFLKPDRLVLHTDHIPSGPWWERLRPLVDLDNVAAPSEIFGNPIGHLAHASDVLRLQILKSEGGVYLDTDVWTLKRFEVFSRCECVLGLESDVSVCNAVIIAKPNSEFLSRWFNEYRTFDTRHWNHHSVVLPYQLSRLHPELVHLQPRGTFFYPPLERPEILFFENRWQFAADRIQEEWANARNAFAGARNMGRLFVNERSVRWTYRKQGEMFRTLQNSHALHLWGNTWARFCKNVTPEFLLNSETNLSKIVRSSVGGRNILAGILENGRCN